MQEGNSNGVYSKKIRAGRRRTYFFDVRTTKSNDYYLTITESKKRFDDGGYDRHKLFLYKEDFNKFIEALEDTVNHVKTQLLPEYDFDEFSHKDDYYATKKRTSEAVPSDKIENTDPVEPESNSLTSEPEKTENKPELNEVKEDQKEKEHVALTESGSDPELSQDADDMKWE